MVNMRTGLAAAAAFMAFTGAAHAAGFAIREQSAEGQGASFAGIAAGGEGLSSMFWNPATITLHDGLVIEANGALILPYSRAEDGSSPAVPLPGFGDSGNIGVSAFAPSVYASYRFNDMLSVGLGANAPFGLSTDADNNWVGASHGNLSEIVTYNINPVMALRLSDSFALGAGLQVEYMDANLTSSKAVTGAEIADIDGDDWDFGFTAGLLFMPTEDTRIGAGFRSSVTHKLKGDADLATPLGLLALEINAPFKSPEIATVGIRHRVNDQITLLAGAEWTNWSRFDKLQINNDSTGAPISIVPEDWDDSWYFSIGGEYAVNEVLTLRAGAAYEDSGVPLSTRTPRLPDNDRYWLSVGASYRVADWATAHVSYSHVFMEDGDVKLAGPESTPANIPLSASFDQHVDIVSASLTMEW